MPHDPALIAEVRGWLAKAAKDLAAGDYDLLAQPPFLEDAAFHAQQAAEKTLKAFLSWHGVAFRKTHNLVELGNACASVDSRLEPLLRTAAPLTEYAWKFRYPGDPEEPVRAEVEKALSIAHEVFLAVAGHLPPETNA